MKKIYALLLFSMSYCFAYSQCQPVTVRGTSTINTPNYALDSVFNIGGAGVATINNLSSGMFSFTATVAGTAAWLAGVQIKNDVTVGNYIYVQPTTTDNGPVEAQPLTLSSLQRLSRTLVCVAQVSTISISFVSPPSMG